MQVTGCEVVPVSGQFDDVMFTVAPVKVSAGGDFAQLHVQSPYVEEGVSAGTRALVVVKPTVQIPSVVEPEIANPTSQLAGVVLVSLIGSDTVVLLAVAVAGTTFVSVPVRPVLNAAHVDILPGGTNPFAVVVSPVIVMNPFVSVLPHFTLLVV